MAKAASQKRQTKTQASGATLQKTATGTSTDAIEMLKADHRKVEGLFSQFENASGSSQKAHLAEQICDELIIHSEIEEKIFYPACRRSIDDEKLMNEALVEHDSAKVLIADIMECSPDDDFFDAKVKVLSEQIKHHIKEEEQKSQNMFAQAKKAGLDTNGLGEQMTELKQHLRAQAEGRGLPPPEPRTLDRPEAHNGYMDMPRGQKQERDQYGRFTGDDDYGRSHPRSRSRYEDDEAYRSSRSSSSRGGSRYGQDNERRSYLSSERNRGQGESGWFGDPEGHSEASRRGWESREDHRGGYASRSGRYGDDDERYSGRGRSRHDDDDGRRSSRGRDQGQGGWFGDSEGHSEASRRGWEHRR